MTKKSDARRRLLKSIATGSGTIVAGKSLPDSWSRPIVDSVLLPAHAETTDESNAASTAATTTPAPTTTPACCLTPGEYCDYANRNDLAAITRDFAGFYVSIIVAADGGIQASVFDGCNEFSGTGSISCTGGSFSITGDRKNLACAPSEGGTIVAKAPNSMQISGTVICGETTIQGTIAYTDVVMGYKASNTRCED